MLVIALSLIGQLAIVFSGRGAILDAAGLIAPLPVRLLRFFSYFTIQSNLLAAGTALSLMQRPNRDGRLWRVLRADAIVGMTVTFVVRRVRSVRFLQPFRWPRPASLTRVACRKRCVRF